ncbi:MAG: hypothetical protein EKK46_02870 [Rhodocyclaceae bacterium]|nr:MAG: hypothetical protein EKK46_02870 [Rhodocyclaceae bacterium]
MKNRQRLLMVLITGLLTCGSAFADKPSWAGGGKEDKHGREDRDDDRGHGKRKKHSAFNDDHRNLIRDYYGQEFSRGNCPPGLAKKHNGCLPPGQAKKWAMGQPLPRGIEMYDLPPTLLRQLGRTPEGYKYVRVASDVLMIAVGTNLVVDAITDLGRQ